MGGEGSSRSRGKGRGSNGHGDITWLSLFRSILVYIDKEADSIAKLEDKGSTSATAHSNRQMRKKVCFHFLEQVIFLLALVGLHSRVGKQSLCISTQEL